MSRQGSARTLFTSKAAWVALGMEDGESSDSDLEPESIASPPPVEVKPLPPPSPSVPSLTAPKPSKRANKKAQLRAATAQPAVDQPPVDESEQFVVNPVATKLLPVYEEPNGSAIPPAVEPTLPPSLPEPTPTPIPEPTPSPTSGRASVRPINTTTPFAPSLPDSLPVPISPGLGSRKRKASEDLKSSPLSKDPKYDPAAQAHVGNGLTTTTTRDGEKVGVVELALTEVSSNGSVEPAAERERKKKIQDAITRSLWGAAMIFGFLLCLVMGPVWMILLVLFIQTQVYREVTNLFSLTSKTKEEPQLKGRKQRDPWSKTLNWYFFAIMNYFLYGETMIHYFKHIIYADVRFLPFATNHRFISFMLYTFGFMGFVGSLKKQFLKQQFGLYGWVHMSLLIVVVSSHFIVDNILEGMIWFWLPSSLVICNDIFAYIWGITIGRTPLIALSPKKTVEGFVGAFVSTVVFSYFWATLFMRYSYMVCPAVDLGATAFSTVVCDLNPTFVWRTFAIPEPAQALLAPLHLTIPPIPWAPFQLHALVMATFASLVAPFGGFFASGFKRAFNIKDFGDSIPGHGGLTDRMDCQFIMGMFAYVYYSSIVRVHHVTPASVMQTVRSSLTQEQQVTLFHNLKDYLITMGLEKSIQQAIQ